MSVKFGELPAVTETRSTSSRWDQVARDLRQKPGLWACVRVCDTGPAASAMAQAIKRGRIVAFRPGTHGTDDLRGVGRFEAVSRGRETWARFVEPSLVEWAQRAFESSAVTGEVAES